MADPTTFIPEQHPVTELVNGRQIVTRPWLALFRAWGAAIGPNPTPGSVAPADAAYVLTSADAALPDSRVLTDSPSVTWDLSTPGEVSATVVIAATQYTPMPLGSEPLEFVSNGAGEPIYIELEIP